MTEYVPDMQSVPNDVPSLLGVAKRFANKKLHDDAVAICEQALARDDRCAQAHFLIASSRHQQRRLQEAKQHADRAVHIESHFIEARTLLARICFELADFDRAHNIARRTVRMDRHEHAALCILGLVALERDDARAAIKHFTKAAHLAEEKWGYWFGLGAAYQSAENYDQAVKAFYRVLDLKATLPQTHYRLGCIFLELQRLEEANLAFRTAIELNPVEGFLELQRALSLIRKHKYEAAAELLYRLREMIPDCSLVDLALGEVELQQDHYDQALEHFDEAVESNPDRVTGYYKKGVALRGLGRDLDAVVELSDALGRDPRLGCAQLELSEILEAHSDVGLLELMIPTGDSL